MDTKKAIATLLKIAENQQKVINKLAQATNLAPTGGEAVPMGGATSSWEDASAEVTPVVSSTNRQLIVSSARIGTASGMLDVVLTHPSNMADKDYYAATSAIKAALHGKPFGSSKTQAQTVNITGQTA